LSATFFSSATYLYKIQYVS